MTPEPISVAYNINASHQSQNESYITTDGLSWCPAPIWDPRQIFLLLSLIIFRQLRVCWYGAPSVTVRRVCSFQFLLGIASAVFLESESCWTHENILLSLFLILTQPGGQVHVFISPRNRAAQLYPRATDHMELKLRPTSVGQSVLESGSHLELMASLFFCIVNCGILDVRCPLWQEDESLIYSYNCFWALQSIHSRDQFRQYSWPYFTVSSETPATWKARSPYLHSPGTRWPSYTPRTVGFLSIAFY
jgi:hypothetical protein